LSVNSKEEKKNRPDERTLNQISRARRRRPINQDPDRGKWVEKKKKGAAFESPGCPNEKKKRGRRRGIP